MSKSMRVTLPAGAVEWLRTGERGVSSEGIFSHLTGIPLDQGRPSPPSDPSDFRRCRLLVAAVPSFRAKLPRMAELGKQWKAIVDHWDEICAIMDEEASQEAHYARAAGSRRPTGDVSRTYRRMKELLYGQKTKTRESDKSSRVLALGYCDLQTVGH